MSISGLTYITTDSDNPSNYINYNTTTAITIYGIPPINTSAVDYTITGTPDWTAPPGNIFGGWLFATNSAVFEDLPSNSIIMPDETFTVNYDSLTGVFLYPYWISNVPCFLENTKILCKINNKEEYLPIQEINKGTLVKTTNGYRAVSIIGTKPIYNPGNNKISSNRLFLCSKKKYPGLFEDLYITGGHRIFNRLPKEGNMSSKLNLIINNYLINDYSSVLVYNDKHAIPWENEGTFNIWHLALDSNNEKDNFIIYANGILAESSSVYHMKKYNMIKNDNIKKDNKINNYILFK